MGRDACDPQPLSTFFTSSISTSLLDHVSRHAILLQRTLIPSRRHACALTRRHTSLGRADTPDRRCPRVSGHHRLPLRPLSHHRPVLPLRSHDSRSMQQIYLPSCHSQAIPQSSPELQPIRAAHRDWSRPVEAGLNIGTARSIVLSIPPRGSPACPPFTHHRSHLPMGRSTHPARLSLARHERHDHAHRGRLAYSKHPSSPIQAP